MLIKIQFIDLMWGNGKHVLMRKFMLLMLTVTFGNQAFSQLKVKELYPLIRPQPFSIKGERKLATENCLLILNGKIYPSTKELIDKAFKDSLVIGTSYIDTTSKSGIKYIYVFKKR